MVKMKTTASKINEFFLKKKKKNIFLCVHLSVCLSVYTLPTNAHSQKRVFDLELELKAVVSIKYGAGNSTRPHMCFSLVKWILASSKHWRAYMIVRGKGQSQGGV